MNKRLIFLNLIFFLGFTRLLFSITPDINSKIPVQLSGNNFLITELFNDDDGIVGEKTEENEFHKKKRQFIHKKRVCYSSVYEHIVLLTNIYRNYTQQINIITDFNDLPPPVPSV